MRAAIVERFGPPDRLVFGEAPDPTPGRAECLIAVEAIDTLFLDTMLRSGNAPPSMEPDLPWIPGNGVAGRVVAVGEGVDPVWIGRAVGGHTGNRRGAYAELAAVAVDDAVSIPPGLEVRHAAALLHDGPTALKLVEATQLSSDDDVLVLGASGGLGLLLVQLARAHARRVVAIARGAAKCARIAKLEPDAVIDTDHDDWVIRARDALGPAGAQIILDNIGASLGRAAFELLAPGGRYSAHGTPSGAFTSPDPAAVRERRATVTGIETVQLLPSELTELTRQAFAAAAAGHLVPVIGQTFALADAADAHTAIETRQVFGKTLLVASGGLPARGHGEVQGVS
jgi:NADPH2:quinone reductase